MISLGGSARFFLFQFPTDLRKGFEGLICSVEQCFGSELTTGAYFIFLNRRRDRMKVLYWDTDGFAIWYKRLEKGTFSKTHLKKSAMSRREFLMLLEGIIPKRVQRRHSMF